MSWRDYAADAERQFNPQANPEVDSKAEFALRSELSAAARERLPRPAAQRAVQSRSSYCPEKRTSRSCARWRIWTMTRKMISAMR
jgi:hypothetical protein